MSRPTAWVDAAELSELGQCNGVRIWAENPALYAPDSDMPPPDHLAPLYSKAERDAAYESGVQSMARELRRILDGGDCPSSIPPELAEVAALRAELSRTKAEPTISTEHGPWAASTIHEGERYCTRCNIRDVFAHQRPCDPHIDKKGQP